MKIAFSIVALLLTNIVYGQYSWIQKTSMSTGRYGAVGFDIGIKGYVCSGYNTANQTQSDLWEWDQTTNIWTQKANMTNARTAAIAFVIDGYAYVGLGLSPGVFHNDLQRYDPVTNTWALMASLPSNGRYGSSSFVLNDKGYIACGNMGSATGPYSDQLWEYNPAANAWTLKSPMPGIKRYGTRGFAINGMGYTTCGVDFSSGTGNFLNDLWMYNPLTDSWTQKTNFPGSPRDYPVTFEIGNGAAVGSGNNYGGPQNDFYLYDDALNIWTPLPPLPAIGRWAAVGFDIGGSGYVATGILPNNTTTGELWELAFVNITPPVITANGTGGDMGCNPTVNDIDVALGTASISGGCNASIVVDASTASPVNTLGCLWSVTRTFTAEDSCGNVADPVDVTVTYKIDEIAPVITPDNDNGVLGCNPTTLQIESALGAATAVDNCDASVNVVTATGNPVNTGGCDWSVTRTFDAVDSCGNAAISASVTVTYKLDTTAPVVTCNAGGNITVCDGTTVNLVPSADDECDGTLPVTCTRSDGLTINEPFSDGVTTVTCTATDACGNTGTCTITVTVDCNEETGLYCTYTQGAYGTAGGAHCDGTTTTPFLTGLLSAPLVVGGGNNTLTLTAADVANGCIYTRIPGGGANIALSGNATCSNPVGITLNGTKFKNTLLTQTITMGLNLRIAGSDLGNLELSGQYLTTFESTGSGCNSTTGTPVPGTEQTYTLPLAVLTYLGANNTVGDLYDLANQALAGTYTGNNPSKSQIASALDILNNAFDECRLLGGFSTTAPAFRFNNGASFVSDLMSVSAYPNPFTEEANINFNIKGAGSVVTVDIYNLTGQKVATLFNGYAEPGTDYNVKVDGTLMFPGVYFYYVKSGNTVHYDKLTLIK